MQTVPPLEDVLSGEEERKMQGGIYFFFSSLLFLSFSKNLPLDPRSYLWCVESWVWGGSQPTGGCVMWVFVAWICERSEERQHPGSGIIPALNMPCLSYLISSIRFAWELRFSEDKKLKGFCAKNLFESWNSRILESCSESASQVMRFNWTSMMKTWYLKRGKVLEAHLLFLP